ncbi:MAG: hypothetical protein IPK16_13005 [Anaerolineales bacterium]|nr:hypothetical protein [Anaerolineales bacterium]
MTDRTDRHIHHLGFPELAPTSGRTYVALDLETTGLDPARCHHRSRRRAAARWPDRWPIFYADQSAALDPLRVTRITGIRNSDVTHSPRLGEVLPELLAFVDGSVTGLIGHNAPLTSAFYAMPA